MEWEAQGTHAPVKPIIALRTLAPESVVAEATSEISKPKNETRFATHKRMLVLLCRPEHRHTPSDSFLTSPDDNSTNRSTTEP